jgi:hypothetical protein
MKPEERVQLLREAKGTKTPAPQISRDALRLQRVDLRLLKIPETQRRRQAIQIGDNAPLFVEQGNRNRHILMFRLRNFFSLMDLCLMLGFQYIFLLQ